MTQENPFASHTPKRFPRRKVPLKYLRRMSDILLAEAESPDCDIDRKLKIGELIIKLAAAQKQRSAK